METNLYPVYAGNVRIGTVPASSLDQARVEARKLYPQLTNLRVLAPYLASVPSWDVPCSVA